MKDKILKIIREVASAKKLSISFNDDNLNKPFKEMGVDSINVLGIIVKIEEAVGFQLDNDTLAQVKTINQLIEAFSKKAN